MSAIVDRDCQWISRKEAVEVLGCSAYALDRMVKNGAITTKRLPYSWRLLSRADCERLARTSIRPAVPFRDGEES